MLFDLFNILKTISSFIKDVFDKNRRKKEIKHVKEIKKEVSHIIEKPLNDKKDIDDLNNRLMF